MLGALAAEPGVRLPGSRRHEFRLRAETEGVEVPNDLIDKLEAFADSA
jgi:LDH2 family malate/lactate/ureidoglycolate dehydrogenase